jgi:GNAT superfamily N-acetyltransferase
MDPHQIVVSDVIDPEIAEILSAGLNAFNIQASGIDDRQALAVTIRDPQTRKVLGGMTGRTSLGLLFIDLFYLPESLRGTGLGSRLLQTCEDEGRRRGCLSAVLYTLSFQAPEFYEKHGWQRFGEVPCLPEGTRRVFMSKVL